MPTAKTSRFNNAHPNSLIARATPEVRTQIRRAQRRAESDAFAFENWARNGCVSVGLIDTRTGLRPDDLFARDGR